MLGVSSTDFLTMNDLLFIGLSLAFFAIAAAYAHFCELVR